MTATALGDAVGLDCAPVTVLARESTSDNSARSALRELLRLVGADADLPVAHTTAGRPYLPDRPDLHISLSHDGHLVAAAVGVGVEVGIDVQRPTRASAGLLRRCCPPATRAALAALGDDERDHEFARIWTVQEACVKSTGAGLRGRPWLIPVHFGQQHGRWLDRHWHSIDTGFGAPVGIAHGTQRERDAR
jgi:4'-phosphopantetheinyl transferase